MPFQRKGTFPHRESGFRAVTTCKYVAFDQMRKVRKDFRGLTPYLIFFFTHPVRMCCVEKMAPHVEIYP